MKLYLHPASPNCMVVLAVATQLEIALDTETIDLFAGQQRSPDYLAINPNGAVPALRDGDFLLSESNAIIQYLADGKPGNPLWPQDRQRRADIARWQFWSLAHWLPALRP